MTLNILAIGNSFSQDELTFLHQIAKSAGKDVTAVNLFIGGCSLEMHCENIKRNAALYEYQVNGFCTGELVSIDTALGREKSDIIYTHQASAISGLIRTYYPYLHILIEHVKSMCPNAKFYLDETWAYEYNSDNEGFAIYHRDQKLMHERVKQTYEQVARENSLSLIPCGDALEAVRALSDFDFEHGGMSLHRDGFHMHFVYGRYLMGCVLYEYLLNGNALDASFIPYVEECGATDSNLIDTIKYTVHGFMSLRRENEKR